MSITGLLHKSRENRSVANYALRNGWYNVATSRIYYSLFQKMLYLLPRDKQEEIKRKQGDTHKETINLFWDINEVDDIKQMELIRDMHNIRAMRNKADYKSEHITEIMYENRVKEQANRIELEINKLIEGKK